MGKIYLVPTPIGNLKDITLRALEVLESCDIVAAEDTRQSLKLLNHFNIKKPLISYHQHNEETKSEELIRRANMGEVIAVVSDAGSPGISDPGAVIVRKCIDQGVEFEVLPGAVALTTALIYSGLDTTKFLFRGFLPRENKDKIKVIEDIKEAKETLIFYEAPHRLLQTLGFLKDKLGDRRAAIGRELTKLHEEILRGTLGELILHYEELSPRGEYVVLVEGKSMEAIKEEQEALWKDLTIEEHIERYIEEGLSKKDAIKKVAKDRSMQKSEVYKYTI